MTARDACALLRLQLKPARPMVRISRNPSALLVCGAQPEKVAALGWMVAQQGSILLVDLPEQAYYGLAQKTPVHARDVWVPAYAPAQALLSSLAFQPSPWRGAASVAVMRTAMRALSGGETAFDGYLNQLRRHAALALRSGGDLGVTGAARLAALWLWHSHGVGLPAPGLLAAAPRVWAD